MRPIHTLVVHHTASKADAHTWADICAWHTAKGWDGVGYHFGIVKDGPGWTEVEGRPVEKVGAHAKGHNNGTIGIAVEGNYSETHLPREAYRILLRACWRITRQFKIPPENVVGHRELPYATECPGLLFPLERLRGDLRDMQRLAALGKDLAEDDA